MAAAAAAAVGIGSGQPAEKMEDKMGIEVQTLTQLFIENFSIAGGEAEDGSAAGGSQARPGTHPYVDQIRNWRDRGANELKVDFAHVWTYKSVLADAIRDNYYQVEPFIQRAVYNAVVVLRPEMAAALDRQGGGAINPIDKFFVSFYNMPNVQTIRDLKTKWIGQLTSISGTVTRASAVHPELISGQFTCVDCGSGSGFIRQQFKYTEPRICPNALCENRTKWKLDVSKSQFAEWQQLRIQENSNEIPAGSMPRSLKVIMRHEHNVEHANPGDKCLFVGTLIVVPDVGQLGGGRGGGAGAVSRGQDSRAEFQIGIEGLKTLGVREMTYRLAFLVSSVRPATSAAIGSSGDPEQLDGENNPQAALKFTEEEHKKIREMKKHPRLYSTMIQSIAPTIFGHDDIKRGLLLMLLGGVHKTTADKTNLRGDINVCIVGDPSTSKSQFLKYVCQFLPRAIYTSGKASSAAGLTASVVRDADTGEFTIEAGALMLADNGVCCIDEFDKMDPKDQTAIHEAMEQQTISIAKAGINTTLNARTAVLAAANPIKGRYDTSLTLKQNVDISAPIMSRFDLFFVVMDQGNEIVDYNLARHIVNIHKSKEADVAQRTTWSLADLQCYVRCARGIRPKVSPEARTLLVRNYADLRAADMTGSQQTAYRITVRQLESLIRLSEAMARMDMSEWITTKHVEEATRLLRTSIVRVDDSKLDISNESARQIEEMAAANAAHKKREDDKKRDDEKKGGGGGAGGADSKKKDDDDDDDGADGKDEKKGTGKPKGAKRRGGSATGEETATKKAKPTPTATATPADTKTDTKTGESSTSAAAAAAAAPKKEAKKIEIRFNEYKRITNIIVWYMRHEQSKRVATATADEQIGFRECDIVAWYIKEHAQSDVKTTEELADTTRLVQAVIRRLADHDNILLVLSEAENPTHRVLEVHPNYDPESGTGSHLDVAVRPPVRQETEPYPGVAVRKAANKPCVVCQSLEHWANDWRTESSTPHPVTKKTTQRAVWVCASRPQVPPPVLPEVDETKSKKAKPAAATVASSSSSAASAAMDDGDAAADAAEPESAAAVVAKATGKPTAAAAAAAGSKSPKKKK